MKKIGNFLLSILIVLISLSVVSALSLYPNPGVERTVFTYEFRITNNVDCSSPILTKTQTITTNNRGFSFIDFDISALNATSPSYLCEYKNTVLRKVHNFTDVITNSIRTNNIYSNNWTNVTITGSQISDRAWNRSGTDIYQTNLGDSVGMGTNTPTSVLNLYEDNANTGNTGGITIEQDGTGDAILQYLLTGTSRWFTGLDNDDADKFKIAHSSDLGTDTVLQLEPTANGHRARILGGYNASGTYDSATLVATFRSDLIGFRFYTDETNELVALQGNKFGISNNIPLIFQPVAGDVGIATTSPTTTLDVNGSLNVSGGNDLYVTDDLFVGDKVGIGTGNPSTDLEIGTSGGGR